MGESIARMELYLFAAAILQNFEISETENAPISLEPNSIVSFLNLPKEQEFILKFRE